MNKVQKMPRGISLFLVFLVCLEVYYYFIDYLASGIYTHYGYDFGTLQTAPHLSVTSILFAIIVIALIGIVYGFIYRKRWARKFTMIFVAWAAIWPIWGILIGSKVAEHTILLIIYLFMEIYLISDYVREYFEGKEVKIEKPKKTGFYTYGDWTLYTGNVYLKSGKNLDIYFFSKHKPHSGTPCPMPEGYEVGVNERTGLPYLRKKGRKPKVVKPKVKKPETKEKDSSAKKPSNVIYVVSKPQPGQVRGDWAVRSHGKIYSHHRSKQVAIKAAREVAKKRDATVMIQKADGRFAKGFKPRK